MKTVILLENEVQVNNFLDRHDEIKGQKVIIALSPFAMYELDKRGLSYKIPEDYYTPAELSRVGKITHKKVERLCDVIDGILHQEFSELKIAGLRPAKYHIVPLIMTFDVLASKVFQLKRILRYERPNVVFGYSSNSYPYSDFGFCFDNRELLYGKLLDLPGWGVQTVMMRSPPEKYPESSEVKILSLEKKIYKLLASNQNTFYAADALRHHRPGMVVTSLVKSLMTKNKLNVLSLNLGYDLSYCYKTFLNQGIFLNHLNDKLYDWTNGKKLDVNIISKINYCMKNKDVRKYFVYEGIDLYPLLCERIEFMVKQGVPACLAAFEDAKKIIRKRNVKAVLAPYFHTPTSHSIARAARNAGVPAIVWFHGTRINDHEWVHYIELMSSDLCMTYGTMLSKEYLAHAKRWRTKIVPVGSSRLDYIHEKAKLSKDTLASRKIGHMHLVYATTHYFQNDFSFSVYPPQSDNMLHRTQLTMISGIGELDNLYITVKLFPGSHYRDPPLREYAARKGYKNIKWVKDVPSFIDLLDHCDVVVLDLPSTPLVEAVAAGKPVFLLTKHLKIWKPALKLLKRRVACFDNENTLIEALKNYLQTGNYPADLSDNEFLKSCGTYLNDGRSCERAAAEVLKVIRAPYDSHELI